MSNPNPFNKFVVFAADFKRSTVNGLTVIPNMGKAAGAPEWLTCGDGVTSSTFPTPLSGFGATFDGGDYINTGIVDRLTSSSIFTFYMLLSIPIHAGNYYGFCNSGSGGTGINMNFSAIGNIDVTTNNGSGSTGTSRIAAITLPTLTSVAINYSGTTNKFQAYINNKNVIPSPNNIATGEGILNQYTWVFGGYKNGNSVIPGLIGKIYAAGIADGILMPRDISIIDNVVKQGIL